MDSTPNLSLPYIISAQAQKHVTHNEALRALDALVQLSVVSRALATSPASPPDGARYIVAAAPTGAFAGQAGNVAAFQDGAWAFYAPREGWIAWVADEDILVAWSGTAWVVAGGGSGGGGSGTAALLGVNTTAALPNRLAVKSDAVLFSHDDVTPGSGDHRLALNKGAAARTASLLFQSAFSGRAEIGLTGDDHLRFKVSADGTTWRDALLVDRASGLVTMPFTPPAGALANLLVNGDFEINQRGFSGGALAGGAFGHDRWRADTGGASYTVSGGDVTLQSGTLVQTIEPAVHGHASLAQTVLTVSVQALSGGNLTVTLGSASGTIAAGSGVRTLTLATGAGDTGNLAVRIAVAAGTPVFRRLKVEAGSVATGFVHRGLVAEQQLCQRYFQKSYPLPVAPQNNSAAPWLPGFAPATNLVDAQRQYFAVPMRVTPTIAFFSPSDGAPVNGQWAWYHPSIGWQNASMQALLATAYSFTPRLGVTGATAASAYIVAGGWTASAEL